MKPYLTLVAAAMLAGCTTTAPTRTTPTATASKSAIVEAMDGGLVGAALGDRIDRQDRQIALEAEYRALEHTPAGQAVSWQSDGGRWSGSVTAGQPYRVGSQDCRQYTHRLAEGAAEREVRGTACRNPDGSWTLLS